METLEERLATLKAKVDDTGYVSPTEKLDLVKSIKIPMSGSTSNDKVSITFGWQTGVLMGETYVAACLRLKSFVDTSLLQDVVAIKFQGFIGWFESERKFKLTYKREEIPRMLKDLKRWYGLPFANEDEILKGIDDQMSDVEDVNPDDA